MHHKWHLHHIHHQNHIAPLGVISFIKYCITRDFHTTGVLVKNTIDT
jgi:hypothetical protein